MRLLPDVDAAILMATALSSKRRPATLAEIVAAVDLIQGFIPYPEKLGDAMRRLSAVGLIREVEEGYTLAPPAEKIMAALPKKADAEERLATVRGNLAAYSPKGACTPIVLPGEQLAAAILAHKTAKRSAGRNLLMPKPKPNRHFKVEGRWRRVSGTRALKS